MAVDEGGVAENMGKKIQCIGRYVMDGQVLGKGNFARVELATHSVTGCKVGVLRCCAIPQYLFSCYLYIVLMKLLFDIITCIKPYFQN